MSVETPSAASFDPVFHSGPRIAIMTRLVIHRSLRFADLQKSTGLTAGNLSSHLQVLEKAGHVLQERFEQKVGTPKLVTVTQTGEAAFRAYVLGMRAFYSGLDV